MAPDPLGPLVERRLLAAEAGCYGDLCPGAPGVLGVLHGHQEGGLNLFGELMLLGKFPNGVGLGV